jgi:[ribosomal protein S5]-alanine N-acetyltransferase
MIMITTKRLQLIPLSLENLESCLAGFTQMETTLGLNTSSSRPGERQQNVLKLRLQKAKEDPENYMWNTIWIIALCKENCRVGSIMLKGCPNRTGEVTVGYSIDEKYRHKGYMTEALKAFAEWIFQNPKANCIIADTLKNNTPSIRVLEKVGMQKFAEDDECFWYKLDR